MIEFGQLVMRLLPPRSKLLLLTVLLVAQTRGDSGCNFALCAVADFKWPNYPILALQSGIEGSVEVTIRSDAGGNRLRLETISASHGMLMKAVTDSFSGKRFLDSCSGRNQVVLFRFRLIDGQNVIPRRLFVYPNEFIVEGVRPRISVDE